MGVGLAAGEGVVGVDEDDSQPMATSEKTRHPVTAKRRIMRTATSVAERRKELEGRGSTGIAPERATIATVPSFGRRVKQHLVRCPPG
jgi:hypothetical protein